MLLRSSVARTWPCTTCWPTTTGTVATVAEDVLDPLPELAFEAEEP